jgi:DNA-binding NarL/FixJ family response regulator
LRYASITQGNQIKEENKMDTMPTYNPKTDTALGAALAFHEYLLECEYRTNEAREKRDALILEAHAQGKSAYRIAMALGVAESTVGRIIEKRR